MSDYQVAGRWQGDLTDGEKLAVVGGVWWSQRQDRKWLKRGEWVLLYRTKGLQRPAHTYHRTIDDVVAAVAALPHWYQTEDGKRDGVARVAYRNDDSTGGGIGAFREDLRERLEEIERANAVPLARERDLAPAAMSHARKETTEATWSEAIRSVMSVVSWLLAIGRDSDDRRDDKRELPPPAQKELEA